MYQARTGALVRRLDEEVSEVLVDDFLKIQGLSTHNIKHNEHNIMSRMSC